MPYFSEVERERGQQLLRLIHRCDQAAALQLLSSGLAIDVHQTSSEAEHGVSGLTPLILAARKGFGQIVLPLLRAGSPSDAHDFQGLTALMTATVYAHPAGLHTLMHWRGTDAATLESRCFELQTAIIKLIDRVPRPGIRHASCALLLLHSIPSEADRLWSFFSPQLKEQAHQLQEMLNSVKYVVRAQSFRRFFNWQEFAGLQLEPGSIECATGAVLGSQGIVVGTGVKMRLAMHASLFRMLVIRQCMI